MVALSLGDSIFRSFEPSNGDAKDDQKLKRIIEKVESLITTSFADMEYGGVGQYQAFTDDDLPPPEFKGVTVPLGGQGGRWNHIEDLDAFFRKIYEYHQKHGFLCMVIDTFFYLLQCLFTILFVTFLFSCVDYAILFRDKPVNGHNSTEHIKVKLKDGIIPPAQCLAGMPGAGQFFLTVVLIIWAIRVLKMMFQLRQFLEVKRFYTSALQITPNELDTKSWNEIQDGLIEKQRELSMAVIKKELTELDINHRILRHENYLVAMISNHVIPVAFHVPFLGSVAFFSSGYRYNLEAILFWSPWAPFKNSWQLKDEYSTEMGRLDKAEKELQTGIMIAVVINILLTPASFMWQLLSIIFSYADIARREPGLLGARMWSEYSRVKLRHYNELEHQLNARLCRAYKPAVEYVGSFSSHISAVIAKNIIFFAGSFLVVLLGLTVWDEDFLAVEHIMTSIAMLSLILAMCRSVIPNEHVIPNPDFHKKVMVQHIHYAPDDVRNDFSQLFTYKFTHLLSEALSPFLMPFILMRLHNSTRLIVNFFYNETVTVEAVGDVCKYANLDLSKHGCQKWVSEDIEGFEALSPGPKDAQGDMGKVELSLLNFKIKNPSWLPESGVGRDFLSKVMTHADEMMSVDKEPEWMSMISSHPRAKMSTSSMVSMFPNESSAFEEQSVGNNFQSMALPRRVSELDADARMSASVLYLHSRQQPKHHQYASYSSIQDNPGHSGLGQRLLPSIHEQKETAPLFNKGRR